MSIFLLFIGYSLGAAVVLGLTHFNAEQYPDQPAVRWAGRCLVAVLCVLQAAHMAWMIHGVAWIQSPWYGAALMAVAPCFYLLARQVLTPAGQAVRGGRWWWHLLPMAGAVWMPLAVCLPLAFGLGSLYLVWLVRMLWGLRAQRAQWRLELVLLCLALAAGAGVCLLGLWQAWLPGKRFFAWYAAAIAVAIWLVQILLGLRPRLPQDVQEVVQSASYANTTLAAVDVPAALRQLQVLMQDRHLYRDATLNLASLAQALGLGPHQLSELINTRLGKNFSRYLREQRVHAAKAMLLAEPSASVLSVGLNVGFTSQSNFYEAFREVEGMAPGRYRKLMATVGVPESAA